MPSTLRGTLLKGNSMNILSAKRILADTYWLIIWHCLASLFLVDVANNVLMFITGIEDYLTLVQER